MLIKITNKCSMCCSHCMESSTPAGQHMNFETFKTAVQFTKRIEHDVCRGVYTPTILLSGGECTEHPEFLQFLQHVIDEGCVPWLITNGMWLQDDVLREQILKPERRSLLVQVTNDSRFYPQVPKLVPDNRITFVDRLLSFLPLGRGKNFLPPKAGAPALPPLRLAPTSFNLRSITRSLGDFDEAVRMLRRRAMSGLSGSCTPSISEDGSVLIGESRECYKIGTVHSSNEELTKNTLAMRECNRCGLEDDLEQKERRAIGLSTLYGPNE